MFEGQHKKTAPEEMFKFRLQKYKLNPKETGNAFLKFSTDLKVFRFA